MKPRQGGGQTVAWCSPDKKHKHVFLKLDLHCQSDPHAGVIVVTNKAHKDIHVLEVKCLSNELDEILGKSIERRLVFWKIENDPEKRAMILSELTSRPLYIG